MCTCRNHEAECALTIIISPFTIRRRKERESTNFSAFHRLPHRIQHSICPSFIRQTKDVYSIYIYIVRILYYIVYKPPNLSTPSLSPFVMWSLFIISPFTLRHSIWNSKHSPHSTFTLWSANSFAIYSPRSLTCSALLTCPLIYFHFNSLLGIIMRRLITPGKILCDCFPVPNLIFGESERDRIVG